MALLGSPMLMDPHPIQQHAGLHNAVLQLPQEVTKPKARFKPASPKKSGVDGGANHNNDCLQNNVFNYQ